MMIHQWKKVMIVCLVLAFVLINQPLQAKEGILIAVLPFEEGDLDWYGMQKQEILNGITQRVIDQLVEEDGVRVMERSQLDKILEEQNFSQTSRVNPATAAELGKLLGVDALVLGMVNQLDISEVGSISFGPIKVSGLKAVVSLGARIVNVDTAEIVSSVTGVGESTDASIKVSDLRGLSFGTKAFSESVIGKSIEEATSELSANIAEKLANQTFEAEVLQGTVLKLLGDKLIINIGKADSLLANQTGSIIRLIEVDGLSEPVSMPIGKVQVFSVDDHAAILQIIEAQEDVQVGDIVVFDKI